MLSQARQMLFGQPAKKHPTAAERKHQARANWRKHASPTKEQLELKSHLSSQKLFHSKHSSPFQRLQQAIESLRTEAKELSEKFSSKEIPIRTLDGAHATIKITADSDEECSLYAKEDIDYLTAKSKEFFKANGVFDDQDISGKLIEPPFKQTECSRSVHAATMPDDTECTYTIKLFLRLTGNVTAAISKGLTLDGARQIASGIKNVVENLDHNQIPVDPVVTANLTSYGNDLEAHLCDSSFAKTMAIIFGIMAALIGIGFTLYCCCRKKQGGELEQPMLAEENRDLVLIRDDRFNAPISPRT